MSIRHQKAGEPLFVYGTLRSGGGSHQLLADARFLRNASVHGRLHDAGDFPAFVPGGPSIVYGEIWSCTAETLARLDAYEGVDEGLFVRDLLRVEEREVWVYLAGPALVEVLPRCPIVVSGHWR